MDKGSKLAAKSTELVGLLEKVGSEKKMVFSKKKLEFLKSAKFSQFEVECERNSQTSQNVQNLFLFLKKDGVLEEKAWIFLING